MSMIRRAFIGGPLATKGERRFGQQSRPARRRWLTRACEGPAVFADRTGVRSEDRSRRRKARIGRKPRRAQTARSGTAFLAETKTQPNRHAQGSDVPMQSAGSAPPCLRERIYVLD